MFLSKNLKYLRERNKRQTQEGLADALGITRSAISSYEDGRAEPKLVVMDRIAQYFNVTLDQLLKVDLSRLTDEEIQQQKEVSKYVSASNLRILTITVDKENNENVELVPEKARAGYAQGYADREYLSNLPKYQLPFLPKGRTYRAFEITGDSMLPLLPNSIVIGEYVTNWNDIRNGQVCIVVSRNEGIVLKKVYSRVQERGAFLLKSTNVNYRSYEIPVTDVIEMWRFSAYISRDFPEETHSYHELKQAIERIEEEMQEIKSIPRKS
ncbi:MAG: helix-turn-helix domain-containing protein [Cytophagales bacterium]|nr:MAG: helix-turn-helix domain-containing protein [Cytophagales bacterium]